MRRVYCDGPLTRKQLASQLDEGYVLTEKILKGYHGGDVAYFRKGTPEEIERCRKMLADSEASFKTKP